MSNISLCGLLFITIITLLLVGCARTNTSQSSVPNPNQTITIPSTTINIESQQINTVTPSVQQDQQSNSAQTLSPTEQNRSLSTPELIEQAFSRNDITADERLLYLAYAVYDYASLPTRFHSNVGWDGTFAVRELDKLAQNPSQLCRMRSDVRNELERLLRISTTCSN